MDTENRTSRKRNAFATALLTTLAFALGFAEFVLIGITPDVAEGLGEPLTLIGDLVGYYALACAVATPIVALATARADRFKVMAALLVVFNAGNLLTLFADGYALLLVSRVLPAVTSGTLLALALTYVPDIVAPKRVAAVLGLVLAGRRKESGGETGKRRIAVPWFAFGFIGIIGLNSLLQSLCGVETVREIPLNGTIEYVDTFMLTMAMTALGTETSLDKFRQAGARPFVLAGLLYVWLVAGGYFVTKYVVGML